MHARSGNRGLPGGRARLPLVRVVLACLAVIMVAAPVSATVTFGQVVWVSSPGEMVGGGYNTALVVSGSRLVAGYQVLDNDYDPNGYRVRRSSDDGKTWSAPVTLLGSDKADAEGQGMAASGSLVAALFTRTDPGSVRKLVLYRSTDGGASWGSEQTIASRTDTGVRFGPASVAISGSTVLVSWGDYKTHRIRLRRSTDSGASFSSPVNLGKLAPADYNFGYPKMAMSGARAYVVWAYASDSGIHLNKMLEVHSGDGGASFSSARTVSTGTFGLDTRVAASGKRLLVLYEDPQRTLRLARTTNGGSSFKLSVIQSGLPSYRQVGGVAIAGGSARVVWDDNGVGKVYFRSSEDGGATWTKTRKVLGGSDALWAGSPRVAIRAGHTVIVCSRSDDVELGLGAISS